MQSKMAFRIILHALAYTLLLSMLVHYTHSQCICSSTATNQAECASCQGCFFYQNCDGSGTSECLLEHPPVVKKLRSPDLISKTSWQKNLHHKYLKDVILPGTHHSGIHDTPIRDPNPVPPPLGVPLQLIEPWDIPQKLSLEQQLHIGVRFLDVRVSTSSPYINVIEETVVTHAFRYGTFASLVSTIATFLQTYSTEVVVMRIREGTGGFGTFATGGVNFEWKTNWASVNSVVKGFSSHVYMEAADPLKKTLRELQGKLVFCMEHDNPPSEFEFRAFQCKGTFARLESEVNFNQAQQILTKTDQLFEDIESGKYELTAPFLFYEAICSPTISMVTTALLNQCAYDPLTRQKWIRYDGLESLADHCNLDFYYYIATLSNKALDRRQGILKYAGAVFFDFINSRLVKLIIDVNFNGGGCW